MTALAIAGMREIVVLDRNLSPGAGGVLHQELRAALYGVSDAPRVHGLLAGGGIPAVCQRVLAQVPDDLVQLPRIRAHLDARVADDLEPRRRQLQRLAELLAKRLAPLIERQPLGA